MDAVLLERALAGEPTYRRRQIWEWAARGASGYDEMTNVPAPLRARLAAEVPFSTLTLEHEAHARDGTVKALFRTHDGHPVEAVLMRYRDGRRSVCVSSQSGCPLTCTFCATGQMRFGRNLTASEILDQALHFRRMEPINHVVFMGMGEPMLNLDNWPRRHGAFLISASHTGGRRSRRSAGCRGCGASWTWWRSRSGSRSRSMPQPTRCAAS